MMAKIETTAFDSVDYLNTAKDIEAYLDAYLEEFAPDEFRSALDTVARSQAVSNLARRSGFRDRESTKLWDWTETRHLKPFERYLRLWV